jgi:hypothetical protein
MRLTVSILIMVIFCFPVFGQTGSPYDAELANKLGADDYGMKTYVMAFLLAGDRIGEYTQEERVEIQKGHMANINKLAEMGKLILAGPLAIGMTFWLWILDFGFLSATNLLIRTVLTFFQILGLVKGNFWVVEFF